MMPRLVWVTFLLSVVVTSAPGEEGRLKASFRSSHADEADRNSTIYYRNKLEYSTETGYLPINIPFVFDFAVNSPYTTWPLHYTLVPTISSLRWQLDDVCGPGILRGNTDFTFSAATTAIPRGPETRYYAFAYGIRQNFVPRNSPIAPYFEARGGVGNIDAKGPKGVLYAQGQDLTFTLMMGSGVRYNFNPRYSVSFGATYMHISNFYLSEPRYENFGINVWGPMVGVNVRIDHGMRLFRGWRRPGVIARAADPSAVPSN